MVKAPLNIGLVGCGSRGLSIFERLLSLTEERPEQPVVIDIFEPNVFGSGAHWPDQPNYLLLNTVAGQLGVFPDAAAFGNLADARERPGADFLTWCREQRIKVDPDSGLLAADGRDVEAQDFLPRHLLGAYLADAFAQILATAPSWVSVNLHQQAVTAVESNEAQQYVLHTASGEAVTVDRLILTVGHTGRLRLADRNRIEDVYPLPGSLDTIEPGETVLIEGLGLGAMDTLAALTSGRGGHYKRMADASHAYQPSGREPVIFIQSRDGLPFRTRPNGLIEYPRHEAVLLTSARIESLRANAPNRQLDFEQDILPLMLLEMRAAAVAVAHAEPTQALDQLRNVSVAGPAGVVACEALLRDYEATGGAINPQALIWHALPDNVTPHNYHAWIYDTLEADLHESRLGRGESAIKAAIEVWRDLRDRLREAVDFDGLTDASHRQFYGRWHKAINRLVAGPQKERHADLLALCDAGLLTFLKPGSRPAIDNYKRVAGYVQSSGVTNSDCAPVRDLARLGLIRPRTDVPGIDGIDVDAACHPKSNAGEPVRNLWVLGPLAEGSCYYNHYVTSAGAPSRLFMDAHRAATAILEAGTPA
ncbi:FAD/NAD(P)-binding protein [Pseudomonas sp. TH08]|uniref:FAD/NAD(P)-binding protein n=1 Tax=unclassified Pseudomonas TaxID=196821 RepID=UPI001911D44A|nr:MULTISPECIES: FAD/NAD(P)-binding domain-containing protein [unclassified Pseudomonas]MBK5526261.1 FAD/NAD(P)-binding protein [Pseudomonas sp. TH06]MBK5532474.1 FAD/NAD(P)-binding protein [Pseudomonas sp. TH08]